MLAISIPGCEELPPMPPTEPVTADQPKNPLHAVVSELEADYPQWCFAIRQGYGGPRVEAHRPHSTSGLYPLITADPAELRLELDNATSGRARAESRAAEAPPSRNRAGGSLDA
jgi:hypothetical protein